MLKTKEDWTDKYVDHLDDDIPGSADNTPLRTSEMSVGDSDGLVVDLDNLNLNEHTEIVDEVVDNFPMNEFEMNDYRRFSTRANKGKIKRFVPY